MEVSGWKRIFSFPKNLPFLRFSLVSVGFRAMASLAMNKWIALSFGPAGTAIFGQFINLFAVFSSISTEGLARGMVKEGAFFSTNRQEKSIGKTVGSALILLLTILFSQWIILYLSGEYTTWVEPFSSSPIWYFLFPALSALTFTFFSSNFFLIRAQTQYQTTLVTLISFGALGGLAFARLLDLDLMEVLLVLTCGQILVGLSVFAFYFKNLNISLKKIGFDISLAKKILTFTLVVSSTFLVSKVAEYGLVSWSMYQQGQSTTGIWIAMNRLADSVNIPILAVVNSILLPMLAGKSDKPKEIKTILAPLFKQLAFWTFAGLILLYFVYPWILSLLFSHQFVAQKSWISWQLLGDFFKSNSYILSGLSLALGTTRFYFWIEISSVILVAVLTVLLSIWLGELGLFAAHGIRYSLFWVALALRFHRYFI